jgi:hypothetical protein
VVGKVGMRFKVNVIENARLVARAIHLMTHSGFAEGYNLIKDMEGSEFLTLCVCSLDAKSWSKNYLISKSATKRNNLNRLRYCSRERPKGATRKQYHCSLPVPWKREFENLSGLRSSPRASPCRQSAALRWAWPAWPHRRATRRIAIRMRKGRKAGSRRQRPAVRIEAEAEPHQRQRIQFEPAGHFEPRRQADLAAEPASCLPDRGKR